MRIFGIMTVALFLANAAIASASDCLSFKIFQLPQPDDETFGSYEPKYIRQLLIYRADIFAIQAVTEVGSPNPQSIGEMFEAIRGELEVDDGAEQYFVTFSLSRRASKQIQEVAALEPAPLLQISRGDATISEALLVGVDGDWYGLKFPTESYSEALALAKLLGASCD